MPLIRPTSTFRASPISPLETPFRYSQGSAAFSDFVLRTFCSNLGNPNRHRPHPRLQLAGGQIAVAYHTCFAMLGPPVGMLGQQGLQLCLHCLVNRVFRTYPQQLGQRIVACLSTGQLNHAILANSGVSPQVGSLSRNNKSTRYAAFF